MDRFHKFATERFYISVFLLGYLPAAANEHYQSSFEIFHLVGVVLHFVWPLSVDFPDMVNPIGDFFHPV